MGGSLHPKTLFTLIVGEIELHFVSFVDDCFCIAVMALIKGPGINVIQS